MKLTEEKVVLITPKDEVLGVMNKLEAHQKGILHRAFSIFLFDKKGNILLQRRAKTNTTLPTSGQMLVAPIQEKMKPISKLPREDCGRN